MRKLFVPTSKLGKWSIGLLIAFLLFFTLHQLISATWHGEGQTFLHKLVFVAPLVLAAISGAAAFFTGIIAIIKSKERSIPVFLTTLMGLFILIFCLGEVIAPH